MSKPYIYLLNSQIENTELKNYIKNLEENFKIEIYSDSNRLLTDLKDQEQKQKDVALFIIEDNPDSFSSVAFINEVDSLFPTSKKVLLTDNKHNEEVIEAFKREILDCYVVKPYEPMDEKVFPVIEDLLEPWKEEQNKHNEPITVIGHTWSPPLYNIKNFLSRNLYPFTFLDVEKSIEAQEILEKNKISSFKNAVVVFSDGSLLVNPDVREIAEKVGLNLNPDSKFYDLIIVGAGPAGLAASVYAASEGLSTLVIEKEAPGGQAGCSSHIANYLGFPGGISGAELSKRAIAQAEKFGVEILRASEVKGVKSKAFYKTVTINDDAEIHCYCIVISTGVAYKTLNVPGLDRFSGAGVYYGAVSTEAPLCEGKDVYIIGGGNSAGQAAMYLSHFAKIVRIVILDESLEVSMSQYLIDQINNTENIEVFSDSAVTEALGEDKLEKLLIKNNKSGKVKEYEALAVFIYIGAEPRTDWLPENILRDEAGFIITGDEIFDHEEKGKLWKFKRDPGLLETSVAGIYAAGDVRQGSIKRVASAVGEGAMAVSFVHQYLAQVK